MTDEQPEADLPLTWLGTVRRYWYVFAVLGVFTLVAAVLIPRLATPSYQAERAILLVRAPLPAAALEDPTVPDNPFLAAAGGLTTVAQAVQVAMSGRESADVLQAAGLRSTYEITPVRGEPILIVSVEGAESEDVLATLDRLVSSVDERLERIQLESGVVSDDDLIKTQLLGEQPVAAPDYSSQSRTRLLIVAAGGGVMLLALYILGVRRAAQQQAPPLLSDLLVDTGPTSDLPGTGAPPERADSARL
jgi:hypothetical protein